MHAVARQSPLCISFQLVTTPKRIAVVPGDGIGKEVIPLALQVLRASGAPLQFTIFDWGADRYLVDGTRDFIELDAR